VGIPVAEIRPATWGLEPVDRGIVSRRFHETDEQHHPGAELLGLPTETGSRPEDRQRTMEGRASATFERVRTELARNEAEYGVALLAPFARILVVDAWIGNGDRHSGNWAVITGARGARLAPMYDPTACLGVELTDENAILSHPTDETIARYADRCPSGFGGGTDGRPGILMRELLVILRGWPPWVEAVSELLPRLIEVTREATTLLNEVPEEWLSSARKRFATRMLAHRVTLFL